LLKHHLNNKVKKSMEKEELSLKKKITIWALILIIKIVEPSAYSHQYSKELDEIKGLLSDKI